MSRPEFEPTTSRSEANRANHYTIEAYMNKVNIQKVQGSATVTKPETKLFNL